MLVTRKNDLFLIGWGKKQEECRRRDVEKKIYSWMPRLVENGSSKFENTAQKCNILFLGIVNAIVKEKTFMIHVKAAEKSSTQKFKVCMYACLFTRDYFYYCK